MPHDSTVPQDQSTKTTQELYKEAYRICRLSQSTPLDDDVIHDYLFVEFSKFPEIVRRAIYTTLSLSENEAAE